MTIVSVPAYPLQASACSRCFGQEHVETARKAEIINISERNTKGRVSLNHWRSSHHPIHVAPVLQQELDRVSSRASCSTRCAKPSTYAIYSVDVD